MDTNEDRRAPDDPVAGWVAEGMRDVEIAVRLGVSVGEARARRSRLSTSSPPPAAHPSAEPLSASGPREAPALQAKGWLQGAAPALAVGLLAAAGAWWLATEGGSSGPNRAVTPVTAFASFAGERPEQLREGPPVELPAAVSLVRHSRDGRALERLYKDSSGALRREPLLTAPAGATIGATVSDTEGWTLVVALDYPETTAFVRSFDGGVTWEELGTLPGRHHPIGLWEDQAVAWRDAGGGLGEFTLVPSGAPFVPPYQEGGLPIALLSKGRLLWRAPGTGRIVESDRAPYLSPDIEQGSYHEWLAPQPTGAGTMIQWSGHSALTGEAEAFIGILNSAGELTQQWAGLPGRVAGRTDGATLVAVAPHPAGGGGWVAVLVELQKSRWRPLAIGLDLLSSGEEHFVATVRRGPFVRVQTRHECAAVLASPDRTAPEIACYADGVILRSPGDLRVHNDHTWRQVLIAAGRAGWIDIGSLE